MMYEDYGYEDYGYEYDDEPREGMTPSAPFEGQNDDY